MIEKVVRLFDSVVLPKLVITYLCKLGCWEEILPSR